MTKEDKYAPFIAEKYKASMRDLIKEYKKTPQGMLYKDISCLMKKNQKLKEENEKLKERLEIAMKGLERLSEYGYNHSDISRDAKTMKKMATQYLNKTNKDQNDI